MDDQEAFEGDDFTFQIDCDGSPKPVAKWTKEGAGIDTKDGHFTIVQNDPNVYKLIIKGIWHSIHEFLYSIDNCYGMYSAVNIYSHYTI